MAHLSTVSITDNGTYALCQVHRPRGLMDWKITISVSGTWGSGSFGLSISFDGGTTKIPIDDGAASSPTAFARTSDFAVNINPPSCPAENSKIILYAVLSGATSPVLSVDVYDTE